MSRAAVSKSRADKGSKPPPAHTPVVAHEIVPGKFTDQDWYGKFCFIFCHCHTSDLNRKYILV